MKIILLYKLEFSSAKKTLFLLETQNIHSSASDWWEWTKHCLKENAKILPKNFSTQGNIKISIKKLLFLLKTKNNLFSKWKWENTKSSFKENARTFSKSSTTQENIKISKPKKRLWNLYKKKISNQKSNQWLETYKMNFINKKTNKKKVLNFLLTLGRSWRAKKKTFFPKLSSEYLNFFTNILISRKYLMNTLVFVRQKYI